MELDDEPFPWQLEKLLPEWSEGDDATKGIHENGLPSSRFRSTDCVFEGFQFHLRDLLSAVPEDDPLLASVQTTLCLPRLEGRFKLWMIHNYNSRSRRFF